MRTTVFAILCAAAATAFGGRNDRQLQLREKEKERTRLQASLETMRDSLQVLIARQYSFKQQTVEQREADKEEFDRFVEQQTRLMNELSRIKEERLSREQVLEDERRNLAQKKEEWSYLRTHLAEIYQKDADGIVEAFPLDKELRRADIERVRTRLGTRGSCAASIASFVDYRLHWFAVGDSVGLFHAVVAPEAGAPLPLTIARFGNVLGYGLDTAGGGCYYLRQTGRLGSARYTTEKIAAAEIAANIGGMLTQWSRSGRIIGEVPLEVMQNDQTRMLIAGKRQSNWEALYESLSKGGWVMIPMLLLPFWVLYLALFKVMQYTVRGHRMRRQFRTAMRHLEKQEYDAALSSLKNSKKGVMGHIVQSCVERRPQGRGAGERAMYELISLETPPLTRSLNTLAVIAGAAPLLGLLGTISGMITLFAAVTHYGTGDPKFLAGGISEALITAKTGLAIAIPVLFIHDLLRGAKDRLLADLEKNGIAVLNAVYPGE